MAGKLEGLSREARKKMWTAAGLDGWFQFLNELKPDGGWTRTVNSIKGYCVLGRGHVDSTPSMEVLPTKGITWCFPCGGGVFDVLEFLRLVRPDQSIEQLYYLYAQQFGLKTSVETQEALRYETEINHFKQEFVRVCTLALSSAVTDTSMAYAQDAVAYLRKRNVDLNLLHHYKLGVFPTRRYLWQNLDSAVTATLDEYFPTAFKDSPDSVGPYGGRIVLPYHHHPQRVARFKLRSPDANQPDVWIGPEPPSEQGFFGMSMYPTVIGNGHNPASRRAVLMEGEFDQLAFAQAQYLNDSNNEVPVFAGGGGAVCDVGRLSDVAFHEVLIVGDNDAGGDAFVKAILRGVEKDRLDKFSIFTWPPKYTGLKDPDEVVQAGRYAEFRQDVLDRANHVEPHAWATRCVLADIATMSDPSSRQKVEAAKRYGSLLHNPVDFDTYIEDVSRATGLRKALLDKHVTDISSGFGFVEAIQRNLLREFTPMTSQGSRLKGYDIKRKRMFVVAMNPPRNMELAIQGTILNRSVFQWVSQNVGIPTWISTSESTRGTFPVSLVKQVVEVGKHFDAAMQEISAMARPETDVIIRSQGIHFIRETDADALRELPPEEDPARVYLVNGTLCAIGHRDPGTGKVVYTELQKPSHAAFMFELNVTQRWSDNLLTVDDLNQVPSMSVTECYELSREVVNYGWRFLRQDLQPTYLAAMLLISNSLATLPNMTFTFFTAPTASGKSTLLLGVFSRKKYPDICLVESSMGYDNFTEAGVMQSAKGSSLLRCFDEFEDPDSTDKGGDYRRHVKRILYTLRNMESGIRQDRGTSWGEGRVTYHKFPAMAAGIHPFQQDVDVNRWITVEFDKTEGQSAPDQTLPKRFGLARLAELRKCLTLHAVQGVFELRDIYDDLSQSVLSGDEFRFKSSRSARLLLPALTALKWAGQPYKKFGADYCEHHEEMIVSSSISPEEGLFRAVFQTNGVAVEGHHNKLSVINVLSNPEMRHMLSFADIGVYWVDNTNFVVIYPDKLPALLKHNPHYRASSNTNQMYQLLHRHPLVGSDSAFFMRRPAVLRHLKKFVAVPRVSELLYVKWDDLQFSQDDQGDPPDDM